MFFAHHLNSLYKKNHSDIPALSFLRVDTAETQSQDCVLSLSGVSSTTPFTGLYYSTDNKATWSSMTSGGLYVNGAGESAANGSYTLVSGTHGQTDARYERGDYFIYYESVVSSWGIYKTGTGLLYDSSTLYGTYRTMPGGTDPAPTVSETQGIYPVSIYMQPGVPVYIRGIGCSAVSTENRTIKFNFGISSGSDIRIECGGELDTLIDAADTVPDYCYRGLFTSAPILNTPQLASEKSNIVGVHAYEECFYRCYELIDIVWDEKYRTYGEGSLRRMFSHCASLTAVPKIKSHEALPSECCWGMYYRCGSLQAAGGVECNSVEYSALKYAFSDCSSLASVGGLDIGTVADSGCREMFKGCTALVAVDSIRAHEVGDNGMYSMFSGCSSLLSVPTLTVYSVGENGMREMFSNCSSLTAVPDLEIKNEAGVYGDIGLTGMENMFIECTGLISAGEIKAAQVGAAALTGMYYACSSLKSYAGCTFSRCGNNIDDCMFMECSQLEQVGDLNFGDCSGSVREYNVFPVSLKTVGNITIHNSENNAGSGVNTLAWMFRGCAYLTSIGDITVDIVDTTTAEDSPFWNMLKYCIALTTIGNISIGVAGPNCFKDFASGTATTAPKALTTIGDIKIGMAADSCCYDMFKGRTSLVNVGDIYIGTAAPSCCYEMFSGCTNLAVVGNINGDTSAMYLGSAAASSFYHMFYNCSSMNFRGTKELFIAGVAANSCCDSMFYGCKLLTRAPNMEFTAVGTGSFTAMYKGCTALTSLGDIKVSNESHTAEVPVSCFANFINGCTALRTIGDIEFDVALSSSATSTTPTTSFTNMLAGCTGITTVGNVIVRKASNRCCKELFKSQTNITSVGNIDIGEAAVRCCADMFASRTTLTTVGYIRINGATTASCIEMFKGCSNLATVGANPETALQLDLSGDAEEAYSYMFSGCVKLNIDTASLPVTAANTGVFSYMFENCASLPAVLNAFEYGAVGVSACRAMYYGCTSITSVGNIKAHYPAGTAVAGKYCFKDTFYGCIGLASAGDIVIDRPTADTSETVMTSMDRTFYGCTALESIGDITVDTACKWLFSRTFTGCTGLARVGSITIGTIANRCCSEMFNGCTSLQTVGDVGIDVDNVGAHTVATYFCYSMFEGCTSLSSIGELLLNPMGAYAYARMFKGDLNLQTIDAFELSAERAGRCFLRMFEECAKLPDLGITLLSGTTYDYCYAYMFSGCSSMTVGATIDTTILASYCCHHMYDGCTNLTSAGGVKATECGSYSCSYMYNGCSKLSTVENNTVTSFTTGSTNNMEYMFAGTKLTSALLPAVETTTEWCFYNMFRSCGQLLDGGILNGGTEKLATGCYNSMYYACGNLRALEAHWVGYRQYENPVTDMLRYVTATGTLTTDSTTEALLAGYLNIPTKWTIKIVDPEPTKQDSDSKDTAA